MQKATTSYFCDVCKKEVSKEQIKRIVQMPVLFITEQTEGRSCKPYVTTESIDFCPDCLGKAIQLKGSGAQGYNEYWFKGEGK